MNDTRLTFILGSGRCGTKALVKMLAGTPDLEAHHEYCRYAYQREAVLYALGYIGKPIMERKLRTIFESAAYYSEAGQFLDSSHKLVPVADLLVEMFPTARFIHLVRDGRKVCASFYYKLQIHDDRAAQILKQFVASPGKFPVPPPSERYWFMPAEGDRFQRIVHHWADSNARIEKAIARAHNRLSVRLEDLTGNEDILRAFIDFIGVPYTPTYWQFLQKPDHAYVPVNYKLTDEQRKTFERMAGDLNRYYGYTGVEKNVNYYKV